MATATVRSTAEVSTRLLAAYQRGYAATQGMGGLTAQDVQRLGFVRWLVQTGALGADDQAAEG